MNLNDAIIFAANAHRYQLDKAGKPYILHCLRVMLAVEPHGQKAMIAAVLHDVAEDTDHTLTEIQNQFGDEVAGIVDAVSRREHEIYRDFIKRANSHPIGRVVKIADVQDNLRPDRLVPELKGIQHRYAVALDILGAKL